MNFCLNRDTKLQYVREPVFDKKKIPIEGVYMQCLNPSEFMAVCPRFSDDFSKLMYFGAKEKFISHCGNYQLRYLKWPPTSENECQDSELVVDKFKAYPTEQDEFAGIFGYNQSLISYNFIGSSNRFAVIESPFKAQGRVYIVDLESKKVKWLNFLGKEDVMHGDYELQRLYKDTAIVRFSAQDTPTQIYSITFNGDGKWDSIEEVQKGISVKLLE